MRGQLVAMCLLLIASCVTTGPQTAGPIDQPTDPWREQFHWVPMREPNGTQRLLYTLVCRPLGDAPARVVLINHGSPPDASARPRMRPMACDSEAVQWFLARGYLVMQGMRRGYGRTGGDWMEGFGRQCRAADYAHAGLETARDIAALATYAASLPYARPGGEIIVGHSAGGWGADAYDSIPHPQVAAMISMAGGRGGHVNDQPNKNCRPDELASAAGIFGATATTPMLWIYAANDTFFSPQIAAAMYAAFTRAGGKAELDQPGPFASDGHFLFNHAGGTKIWGPLVERYLAARFAGR